MKAKGQTEKWITAGLGLIALVLVVNLIVREKPAVSPAKRPASATTVGVSKVSPPAMEELTRYDPALQLDKFKAIQERPASTMKRNPFEFVTHEAVLAPVKKGDAPNPVPSAPAAPPPPPLKAVGYTQTGANSGEAFVTLQDELFVVHEGETFAKHFKVNKLTPTVVEVFDESTQQTIRLPIGG